MNLGLLEIKKAFLGGLELSPRNAYLGQYSIIKDRPAPVYDGPLMFTSLEDGNQIGMTHKGTNATSTIPVLQYSLDDGESWTDWFFESITLNAGDKVLFRGDNPDGIGRSISTYSTFTSTKKYDASGNAMSLISKDDFRNTTSIPTYGFVNLFTNNVNIMSAPALPATTLGTQCYYFMFNGCASLTSAPDLPATTLTTQCYYRMFQGCTSLTSAPALPATTLAGNCYNGMFYGCTSLTTAPVLPATTLASSCYQAMFSGCTSLTTAPALPATTLASSCYQSMFYGCTSLTSAPDILPATTLIAPSSTLYGGCYASMFNGCTSLTSAPVLPATNLVTKCYQNMFNGCSQLAEVTTYATTWDSTAAQNWLSGVASAGMFYNLGNATNIPTNVSGCPSGWTLTTTKQ